MRPLLLFAASLALVPAAEAQHLPPANALPLGQDAAPDAVDAPDLAVGDAELTAQIERIEATLRLPAGARPLGDYARYYAWADEADRKVTGILTLSAAPGRKWVDFDSLPAAMGRQCSVIELVFDVRSGAADAVYCLDG